MEKGRRFMDEDFEDEALERAYRRGCKDGKEKGYRMAMEEMHGYGQRGGSSGGSGSGSGGGYGQRDWEEEDYGERRGVRGTGSYSRYRR